MPRRRSVRSVADLNFLCAKSTKRSAEALTRVTESVYVANVCKRYFRLYFYKMRIASRDEHARLFRLMPSYESIAYRADQRTGPRRRRHEQRARARWPRRFRPYPIGAESYPGGPRLPLRLDAWIAQFVRDEPGRVREVWNKLGYHLEAIASDIERINHAENPRADRYKFRIDDAVLELTFRQFERICTDTRKGRRIGQLD
jgi:hypothetical protein